MRKLLEGIAATAEIMGREISPAAAMVTAQDLSQYPHDVVMQAMANLRRDAKARFSTGAIIEQIEKLQPDGRQGADEAWAMIPMDEYTSAVMTQEMAEAMHIAQPLLDAGDKIAARMSFKEAYNRIVESNKRNGVKPSWFPSLGQDKEGRDTVLAEAVRLGRIGVDHAIGLLPPEKIAPMLQSAGKENLALEYKLPSTEETMGRIQAMKDALKSKIAEHN
jgi:hypothetical protein